MSFKKGQSGNPKGRKKGAKNIITTELKEMINKIVSKEMILLPDLLEKMQPDKRMELIIKLLAYILPKPDKNIKIENIEVEPPLKIYIDSKELDL